MFLSKLSVSELTSRLSEQLTELKESITDFIASTLDLSLSGQEVAYNPPLVQLKIAGQQIDCIDHFVSIDIIKKAEGFASFSLELIDATFILEELLLQYNCDIEITYAGSTSESVTRVGKIHNSRATTKLSSGSRITCTGVFSNASLENNTPRSYPYIEYGGDIFLILKALCDDLDVKFAPREDVDSKILEDSEGNAMDVISDTSETDSEFMGRLIRNLDGDVRYIIQSATSEDEQPKLLLMKSTNSAQEITDKSQKLTLDLNYRTSIVTSYDFNIRQGQFHSYGGNEVIKSIDPISNQVVEYKESSISDSTSIFDNSSLNTIVSGAKETVRWLAKPSMSGDDIKQEMVNRNYKKLQALYDVTLELMECHPEVMPFYTELTINSWLSGTDAGTKLHHTSGIYTIKEVVDHITNAKATQTITAFRTPNV